MEILTLCDNNLGKGVHLNQGVVELLSINLSYDINFSVSYELPNILKSINDLTYTNQSYINYANNQHTTINNSQLKSLIDLLPHGSIEKIVYNQNTSSVEKVSSDNNTIYLDYYTNTKPSTPTNGVKLYSRYGRMNTLNSFDYEYLLASDENYNTQKSTVLVTRNVLTYNNSGTWALLPSGQTNVNINGSDKILQNNLARFTANSGVEVRFYTNTPLCWIGDTSGLGGFTANFKFGISDTGFCSDGRLFIGLHSSTVAPNTSLDTRTLTNMIGLVQEPNISPDGKLYFIVNGTSATTDAHQYSGITLVNNGLYNLFIHVPSFSNKIYFWLSEISSGLTSYWVADSTLLSTFPSKSVLFTPRLYRRFVTTGNNPGILFSHFTLDLLQG